MDDRYLTREKFRRRVAASNQQYWLKTCDTRWKYIKRAVQWAKQLAPATVLELGANGITVCEDSDQICLDAADGDTENSGNVYLQDARTVPWPFGNKQYDLMIALQVLEHLGPNQSLVFSEIARVANWAIISLPYWWHCPQDPVHHMVTDARIQQWSSGRTPVSTAVVGRTKRRILLLYQFP